MLVDYVHEVVLPNIQSCRIVWGTTCNCVHRIVELVQLIDRCGEPLPITVLDPRRADDEGFTLCPSFDGDLPAWHLNRCRLIDCERRIRPVVIDIGEQALTTVNEAVDRIVRLIDCLPE